MRVPAVPHGGHQKRIRLSNSSIPANALLALLTINRTPRVPA